MRKLFIGVPCLVLMFLCGITGEAFLWLADKFNDAAWKTGI